MGIRVVNVYKEKATHYCGRPHSFKPGFGKNFSIFGNPYWLNNESKREEACSNFETYFHKNIHTKFAPYLMELIHLARTEEVKLGCFCKPKRCHCDTIKNYIESKL